MMTGAPTLLILHAAATLGMWGLILAVQLVIYPQFRSVSDVELRSYAESHSGRMISALTVLGPAEVLLAGWLFVDPPAGLGRGLLFASGALLAAAWVSTAIWFAPLHGKIQTSGDRRLVEQLIVTNWTRTALWTGRAGLAAWFLSASGA